MGCFSSVNLSIAPDKKTISTNKQTINKTELQNQTYEEHSCKIDNDNNNNNNKNNNLNINNIPLDVLKSYQYYITNKNYKSCEVGRDENKKEKKIKMLKINGKKETNEERKNINIIEDMDVDINIYKKYVIKDENNKKENKHKEKEVEIEINNDINDISNSGKRKNENKVLRKSIEERITKYNIKKDEKNKELDDSICNLGISYIKEKGDK